MNYYVYLNFNSVTLNLPFTLFQSLAEDTHDNSKILARSIPSRNMKRSSMKRASFTASSSLSKSSSSNSLNGLVNRELGISIGSSHSDQRSLRHLKDSNSLQDVKSAIDDSQGSSHCEPVRKHSASNAISRDVASIGIVTTTATDVDGGVPSADDHSVAVLHNRKSLVKMVAAIRVLPLHLLLDTVKQVLRQPPTVEGFVQVRDENSYEILLIVLYLWRPFNLFNDISPIYAR